MTSELNILVLFREGVDIQIVERRSKAKCKGTLKDIYNEVNTIKEFKIGAKNRNNQCYMISKVVLSMVFHHNRKVWEVYGLPWGLRW